MASSHQSPRAAIAVSVPLTLIVVGLLVLAWMPLLDGLFRTAAWHVDPEEFSVAFSDGAGHCSELSATVPDLSAWNHECVIAPRHRLVQAKLAASFILCGQRIAQFGTVEWGGNSACGVLRATGQRVNASRVAIVAASSAEATPDINVFAYIGSVGTVAFNATAGTYTVRTCGASTAVEFLVPDALALPPCLPNIGPSVVSDAVLWPVPIAFSSAIALEPHPAIVAVVVLLLIAVIVLLALAELRVAQHIPLLGPVPRRLSSAAAASPANASANDTVSRRASNTAAPGGGMYAAYSDSDGGGDSVGPMSYNGSDDGDGGGGGLVRPPAAAASGVASGARAGGGKKTTFQGVDTANGGANGFGDGESEFNFDRPTVANVEDVFISCDLAYKDAATVVGVRVVSNLQNLVGKENDEAAEFLEGLEAVVVELAKKRDVRACLTFPGSQSGLVFFGGHHAPRACRAALQIKRAVTRWNNGQPMRQAMNAASVPVGQRVKRTFNADVSVGVSTGPAYIGTSGQYEQSDTTFGLATDALEHLLALHPVLCSATRASILATAAVRSAVSILAEGVALLPVDLVSVPAWLSAKAQSRDATEAGGEAPQPEEQLPTAPLAAEPELSITDNPLANRDGVSQLPPSVEHVFTLGETQGGQQTFAALAQAIVEALEALSTRDRDAAVAAAESIEEAFEVIEARSPFDAVAVDRTLLSRILRCCTELDEEGHVALFEVSPSIAIAGVGGGSVRADVFADNTKEYAVLPRRLLMWNVAGGPLGRDSTTPTSTRSGMSSRLDSSAAAWRTLLKSAGAQGATITGMSTVSLHTSSAAAHHARQGAAGSTVHPPGSIPDTDTSGTTPTKNNNHSATAVTAVPSGSSSAVTPAAAAAAANQTDADLLDLELRRVIEEKERKAAEAAERAAAAAAEAAANPPPEDDEDEDGGGFGLFSFVPVVAAVDPEAEEKEVEPKRFTDCRGADWCLSSRMLGSGAFGNVFLGMGAEGQMVAIKAIKISVKSKEECKNVLKEIRLLGRLKSDRIVQYMASAVVGSFLMIVMEAVGGGSLLGVTQQFARLPQKLIVAYLRDCLSGVRNLHSNGIVHRDIKPHNVLITEKGRCKLADFGTACHITYATASEKSGDITGTVIYMAPEACDGILHVRSDIWSTGIMAYQLAMKALPYHHNDLTMPYAILSKLGKRDPSVFRPGTDDAPAWLKPLIDRALEFDPDLRPSAGDLLRQPPLT